MEHARKMVVVPHEVFERLQAKTAAATNESHQQTAKRTHPTLDDEMESIMNDKKLDDSEKWKLYNQVLQRFLNKASINRQPLNIPILDTTPDIGMMMMRGEQYEDIGEEVVRDNNEQQQRRNVDRVYQAQIEDIAETFTKTYRNDARQLLRFMSRPQRDGNQSFGWTDNNEVIIDGRTIPGSNIVDLTHAIVRTRAVGRLPVGWNRMINVLKRANVPKEYIHNKRALEELNNDDRVAAEEYINDDDIDASLSNLQVSGEATAVRDARSAPEPDRLRSAYMRRTSQRPYPRHQVDSQRQGRKEVLNESILNSLNNWEPYNP